MVNRTPRFGNAELQDDAKGTKNNLMLNAIPSALVEQRDDSITPGRSIPTTAFMQPAAYTHFSGLLRPGAVFRFLGESSNL